MAQAGGASAAAAFASSSAQLPGCEGPQPETTTRSAAETTGRTSSEIAGGGVVARFGSSFASKIAPSSGNVVPPEIPILDRARPRYATPKSVRHEIFSRGPRRFGYDSDVVVAERRVQRMPSEPIIADSLARLDGVALDRLRALARDVEQKGENIFVELIGLFRRDAYARVELLREALANEDGANIVAVAHALKGAAGNVGALRVEALSRHIEDRGRRGDLAPLPRAVDELRGEIERTLAALESALLG